MKLFNQKPIDEQEIAIKFACGLTDEELKDLRKAIDFYREGDKLQAECYEKGNAILARDELDIAVEEAQ